MVAERRERADRTNGDVVSSVVASTSDFKNCHEICKATSFKDKNDFVYKNISSNNYKVRTKNPKQETGIENLAFETDETKATPETSDHEREETKVTSGRLDSEPNKSEDNSLPDDLNFVENAEKRLAEKLNKKNLRLWTQVSTFKINLNKFKIP